jgi:aspartate/methionine/tyrosine aminotransferase
VVGLEDDVDERKEGTLASCRTLLDLGDELNLVEPYYGYHRAALETVGARVSTTLLCATMLLCA